MDQNEILEFINWNSMEGTSENAPDRRYTDILMQTAGVADTSTHYRRSLTDCTTTTTTTQEAAGRNVGSVEDIENFLEFCQFFALQTQQQQPLYSNMDNRISKSSDETELLLNRVTSSSVLEASAAAAADAVFGSKAYDTEIPFDCRELHFVQSTYGSSTVVPSHSQSSALVSSSYIQDDYYYSELSKSGTDAATTSAFIPHQRNVLDDCSEVIESYRSVLEPQNQMLVCWNNLQSSAFSLDYCNAEDHELMSVSTVDSLPHALSSDDCLTPFHKSLSHSMDVATTNWYGFQSQTQDGGFGAQNQFILHSLLTTRSQTGGYDYTTNETTQKDVDNNNVKSLENSSDITVLWKTDLQDVESALNPLLNSPHRLQQGEDPEFSQVVEEQPFSSHYQRAQRGTMQEFVETVGVDDYYGMKEPQLQVSQTTNGASPLCMEQNLRDLGCQQNYYYYDYPSEDLSAPSPEERVRELMEGNILGCSHPLDESLTQIRPTPAADNEKTTVQKEIATVTTPTHDPCYEHKIPSSRRKGSRLAHSPRSLEILRTWWKNHQKNPYPNWRDLYELSGKTGLTYQQIYDWFKNERSRRFKTDPINKRQKRLPAKAIQIFSKWALEHLNHPNPTKQERELLAADAGVKCIQVSHWFMNFRKRSKATMKKVELGQSRI